MKRHLQRYLILTVIIFLSAGTLHALRLAYGWDLVIGGFLVPSYFSALLVIIALGMVIMGFDYVRRK